MHFVWILRPIHHPLVMACKRGIAWQNRRLRPHWTLRPRAGRAHARPDGAERLEDTCPAHAHRPCLGAGLSLMPALLPTAWVITGSTCTWAADGDLNGAWSVRTASACVYARGMPCRSTRHMMLMDARLKSFQWSRAVSMHLFSCSALKRSDELRSFVVDPAISSG
jgi:hypothetical protein